MENPVNNLQLVKRIADPIHGLIRLTDIESKVLDHPAFQRLRGISQLGMAKYVYPGATHTRFSHSLGVLNNVTRMYNAAFQNFKRNQEICGEVEVDWVFSDRMLQITRLAALCHDLGHFPFSHNLEQAFTWLTKAKITQQDFSHEKLSGIIVNDVLSHILDDFVPHISALIEGQYPNFRNLMFPGFLVSSAIDGDRMDYLFRDALYCGVEYGSFDTARLLDSIMPYHTNIDGKDVDILGVHYKGIEAVEQFLLARHRMHQTIYFNPTVVSFEAGLRRAYFSITTDNPPWELPDTFLDHPEKFMEFDEAELFSQLKSELRKRKYWLASPLIDRLSIRKFGPFHYTQVKGRTTPESEKELFMKLEEVRDQLENPVRDWFGRDHWVYAESKKQTLIDPLPRSAYDHGDIYEDSKSLKNVIFIINEKGNIIDPTSMNFGQTFLPFISAHTYHKFLFFCHKKDTEKLNKIIEPLYKQFELFRKKQPFIQTQLPDHDL